MKLGYFLHEPKSNQKRTSRQISGRFTQSAFGKFILTPLNQKRFRVKLDYSFFKPSAISDKKDQQGNRAKVKKWESREGR
jgi:hypothetical protein